MPVRHQVASSLSALPALIVINHIFRDKQKINIVVFLKTIVR